MLKFANVVNNATINPDTDIREKIKSKLLECEEQLNTIYMNKIHLSLVLLP